MTFESWLILLNLTLWKEPARAVVSQEPGLTSAEPAPLREFLEAAIGPARREQPRASERRGWPVVVGPGFPPAARLTGYGSLGAWCDVEFDFKFHGDPPLQFDNPLVLDANVNSVSTIEPHLLVLYWQGQPIMRFESSSNSIFVAFVVALFP